MDLFADTSSFRLIKTGNDFLCRTCIVFEGLNEFLLRFKFVFILASDLNCVSFLFNDIYDFRFDWIKFLPSILPIALVLVEIISNSPLFHWIKLGFFRDTIPSRYFTPFNRSVVSRPLQF